MSVKVRWLDDFPDHWRRFPSKRLFPESKERAGVDDEQLSATQDYGVIHQKEFMRLAGRSVVQIHKHLEKRKRVELDDFVISMRSFQGGLERAWSAGAIRSSYVVIKPTSCVDVGYFSQLFKSSDYIRALQATAHFIRDGQDLNYQNFCLVDLALPPIEEQKQIAAFLDYETAKIDALIEKQQQLIALLAEKRQAVISHAVTKGLNPDAPMRDSGVEWLGEVPEHWGTGKVKHYFATCSGGTPNTGQQEKYYSDEDNGHPWIRTTDLNNDFVSSVPIYITEQAVRDTACAVLPEGTVMIAMYGGGGTVGKNGLLMFPSTINQAVCGILPCRHFQNEYVFRYMQFYRPHWMVGAESSRKDPNISQEVVKNAPILKPPIQEQIDIVDHLTESLVTFDGLMGKAELAVELLSERRSSLISIAVTGKIDVRGWKRPSSDGRLETEMEVA